MHFEPGRFTELLIEPIHRAAVFFMVVVYILRIRTIVKAASARERTPARGNHAKAIAYSYGILVMPWEIEGYRKHPIRFVEFIFFHAGAAAAIGFLFMMPAFPTLFNHRAVNLSYQIACALAVVAGCARLFRRILNPAMRIISSPDDLFLAVAAQWLVHLRHICRTDEERTRCGSVLHPCSIPPCVCAVLEDCALHLLAIQPLLHRQTPRHRGVYPRRAMQFIAKAE